MNKPIFSLSHRCTGRIGRENRKLDGLLILLLSYTISACLVIISTFHGKNVHHFLGLIICLIWIMTSFILYSDPIPIIFAPLIKSTTVKTISSSYTNCYSGESDIFQNTKKVIICVCSYSHAWRESQCKDYTNIFSVLTKIFQGISFHW